MALSQGDPHHLYGKGAAGSRRDDRLFVPLPDGSKRRGLIWICRIFHDYIHSIGIRKWREENAEYLESLNG